MLIAKHLGPLIVHRRIWFQSHPLSKDRIARLDSLPPAFNPPVGLVTSRLSRKLAINTALHASPEFGGRS